DAAQGGVAVVRQLKRDPSEIGLRLPLAGRQGERKDLDQDEFGFVPGQDPPQVRKNRLRVGRAVQRHQDAMEQRSIHGVSPGISRNPEGGVEDCTETFRGLRIQRLGSVSRFSFRIMRLLSGAEVQTSGHSRSPRSGPTDRGIFRTRAFISRARNREKPLFEGKNRGYGSCLDPSVSMSPGIAGIVPSEQARISLLEAITRKINLGASLEETFDLIYDGLHPFVPYNRIAVALTDEARERLFIIAAKSDGKVVLGRGYSGLIAGSSLEPLVRE